MCEHFLNPEGGERCNQFVDDNKSKFFGIYRNNGTDETAFTLGLCKGGDTYDRMDKTMKGIYCQPCKWMMGELKDMVSGGLNFEQFKETFKNVLCGLLPTPLIADGCDNLIEMHAKMIFGLLHGVEADMACKIIEAC